MRTIQDKSKKKEQRDKDERIKKTVEQENTDWTYAIWEFKTSFYSSNFPLKKK